MSTENYFCNAMIQWSAMLLSNGGTLSLYALNEDNPAKIQRKPNTHSHKLKKKKKKIRKGYYKTKT